MQPGIVQLSRLSASSSAVSRVGRCYLLALLADPESICCLFRNMSMSGGVGRIPDRQRVFFWCGMYRSVGNVRTGVQYISLIKRSLHFRTKWSECSWRCCIPWYVPVPGTAYCVHLCTTVSPYDRTSMYGTLRRAFMYIRVFITASQLETCDTTAETYCCL